MADGLYAALVALVGSLLLHWLSSRGTQARIRDAWQQQATALRNELRQVYERQITFLEGQCQAKDAENERLQRLLGRQQRGSND